MRPQLGVVYKYGDFALLKPEAQRRYLQFLDSLNDLIRGQHGKVDSTILGARNKDDFEEKVHQISKSMQEDRPMAFLFVEPEDTATSSNTKSAFKAVAKVLEKQEAGKVKFNSYVTVNDSNDSGFELLDNTEQLQSVIGKKGSDVVAEVSKFYKRLSNFSLKGDFEQRTKSFVAELINALTKKSGLGTVSANEMQGYEDQMNKRHNLFTPQTPDEKAAQEEKDAASQAVETVAAKKESKAKPEKEKNADLTINDLRKEEFPVWFDQINWERAIEKSEGSPKEKTILVMMKLLKEGMTFAQIAQEAVLVENSFKKPEKRKNPEQLKPRKVSSIEANLKWFRTVPTSIFSKVPGGLEAVKIKS